MARNKNVKPSGGEEEARASYKFPWLHSNVRDALDGEIQPAPTFARQRGQKSSSPDNTYSTHVMGRFRCGNDGCRSAGWGSKKIAIQIRGFSGNRYDAVVFGQRCKRCDWLGHLILDTESYVGRPEMIERNW